MQRDLVMDKTNSSEEISKVGRKNQQEQSTKKKLKLCARHIVRCIVYTLNYG